MTGYEQQKQQDSTKTPTPPPTAPETPKAEAGAAPIVTPPVEGGDDGMDEFGYAKTKAEGAPADKGEPAKKPVADAKKPDEEIDAKATGYGQEPEKVAEPVKEAAKATDKKPEGEAAVDENDFEVKDLGELTAEDIKDIKAFAKQHKVPKEIALAMVEDAKKKVTDFKKFVADQKTEAERKKKETRIQWYQELKADPDFGGEKFQANVKRAEKVMSEFFPNLKKELTGKGGMLPPYVMRDLVKLGNHLYSAEPLINGDPPSTPNTPKEESDDPLDYYR